MLAGLHGRDLRLLPAAPGQPADQAAAAHAAEAGAGPGRERGAGHSEPGGPRLRERLERKRRELATAEQELAELEKDVGGPDGIDPDRLQPRAVVPSRSDVKVLRY